MEANWFPEHLERGAKEFEQAKAKGVGQHGQKLGPYDLHYLGDFAQDLKNYREKGPKAVREWVEDDAGSNYKLTPEGFYQLGLFRKFMKLSVGM